MRSSSSLRRLLVLVAATFLALPATAGAATTTSNVTADAYITDGNTTNHGADTLLHTDNSPVEATFMYFDVTGLGGGAINSATLKLQTGSTGRLARDIRRASGSWTESTINGTNEPPFNGAVEAQITFTATGTYQNATLTSYVRELCANKTSCRVGLAVTTTDSTNQSIYSKENTGHGAQLVVDSSAAATDTTPPSVPGNQRQTGATTSTVTVAWDAATDNVGVDHYLVVQCAPDTDAGCTMANTTGLSATVGPIPCGTDFVVWVEAVDAAGNKSNTDGLTSVTTRTSACSTDTTPPQTTITSSPSVPTTSTSASFSFTSSEAGSSFSCSLDGGPATACTSPKSYSGLSTGAHSFQVAATDAAFNTDPTPATFNWTIDATPTNPTSLTPPLRVAFHYPWYSETEGGATNSHFTPSKGNYESSDPAIIDFQVDSAVYGKIDSFISSWWGQGSLTDGRFPLMLDGAQRDGRGLRIAPYYECEGNPGSGANCSGGGPDPSEAQIESDLQYIKDRYTQHPNYLWIGGKPAIFVYNANDTSCALADKWRQAATAKGFWIDLKVFAGYTACGNQPDLWHQYSPAARTDTQAGNSFTVSAGFFQCHETTPRLARDLTAFKTAVQQSVASTAPIKSFFFNEWCEGSAIESATEWASSSGFGDYIDALHNDGAAPPPPTVQCNDGVDNDGDGKIDFPADPGCSSATDTTESPDPPPSSGPVILAAGDIQPPTNSNVTTALISGTPHDAVLTLGDNQYDTGSLANYNAYFANQWGVAAPNAKIYPAPGNHDSTKGGYCSYFTGKSPIDPCPIPTDSSRQRYKAVINGVSVYSMDTGTSSSTGDFTAADKTWLDGQLASDTNLCQIVYWHHPRYTSSSTHPPSTGLSDDWAMLMARKVDLVLVGHNHDYERFNRMNSTGAVDTTNGIREIVVGTGGASHYGFGTPAVGSQVRNSSAFGVLKLTFSSTGYSWSFLPQAGQTFTDSGSESCR